MINEKPSHPANAPERGGAAEELEYRLRQQRLAAEYALFALRTHDVPPLLHEATRICAQGLQSEMCKIMEYLPEEHQFVVRAGVGWQPGVVGQARTGADRESPTGYAFQTGEPVISNHLEGETRFRTPELLISHGVRRAINALIQVDGERFGVLEVDSPVEGRFTDADLVFVTGLANLLGVALERQRTEQALKQALEHQEVLAREISHRVKNSLAIVAGLLNMQSRAAVDPGLKQALNDAKARLEAVGKVHDQLWRTAELDKVDLPEFLGELCDHLGQAAPGHALNYEIAPVTATTDEAVSLGLLTNELVTNALKHAYPGGSGSVCVALTQTQEKIRLEVSDNGVGLPSGFAKQVSGSLGMRVINSLSHQLGGQVEWQDAKPGTRFVLTYSLADSNGPPG